MVKMFSSEILMIGEWFELFKIKTGMYKYAPFTIKLGYSWADRSDSDFYNLTIAPDNGSILFEQNYSIYLKIRVLKDENNFIHFYVTPKIDSLFIYCTVMEDCILTAPYLLVVSSKVDSLPDYANVTNLRARKTLHKNNSLLNGISYNNGFRYKYGSNFHYWDGIVSGVLMLDCSPDSGTGDTDRYFAGGKSMISGLPYPAVTDSEVTFLTFIGYVTNANNKLEPFIVKLNNGTLMIDSCPRTLGWSATMYIPINYVCDEYADIDLSKKFIIN